MNKEYIEKCINKLCSEIGSRPAGSDNIHKAMDFLYEEMTDAGLDLQIQKYDCPDWQVKSAVISFNGKELEPLVNTYSSSCEIEAELVVAGSLEELNNLEIKEKILVIHGELTTSAYFPKNFDFFRDEIQDTIIDVIEQKKPRALITVSHQDKYVTPIIEDSEFSIPSVTVTKEAGKLLFKNEGTKIKIKIHSITRPGWGANLIGRRNSTAGKRVIICTHYDTMYNSIGAIDNASGVAATLTLAKLLKNDIIGINLEFVAFGGEDSWYPGDLLYIKQYSESLKDVVAVINIDGIGIKGSDNGIAFMACSDSMIQDALALALDYPGIRQMEAFYEGDHSFFLALNIPSMALCAADYFSSFQQLCHTEFDRPELLSAESIGNVAHFLYKLVHRLDKIYYKDI